MIDFETKMAEGDEFICAFCLSSQRIHGRTIECECGAAYRFFVAFPGKNAPVARLGAVKVGDISVEYWLNLLLIHTKDGEKYLECDPKMTKESFFYILDNLEVLSLL